jgi:hypothetical protein
MVSVEPSGTTSQEASNSANITNEIAINMSVLPGPAARMIEPGRAIPPRRCFEPFR